MATRIATGFVIFMLLTVVSTFMGSFFTISEGNVGIVKRFSKAVRMVDSGLHFKIPFVEGVDEMDVRQRKNVEELTGSTANQLPVTARVSLNWTVNKGSAMDLYVQYGSLSQFEDRVLDPKLRNAAKAAISRFPADLLIRERERVVQEIMSEVSESLDGFPITVNSPQLEDITLPPQYLDAVMMKEKAREDSMRENHNLERQRLESLRAVNTAEATKQAKILEAEGDAQATRLRSEAEADAIAKVSAQVARNPIYVDLVRAKQWDGKMPGTILGQDTSVILGK